MNGQNGEEFDTALTRMRGPQDSPRRINMDW
jgi:hypothetical protein